MAVTSKLFRNSFRTAPHNVATQIRHAAPKQWPDLAIEPEYRVPIGRVVKASGKVQRVLLRICAHRNRIQLDGVWYDENLFCGTILRQHPAVFLRYGQHAVEAWQKTPLNRLGSALKNVIAEAIERPSGDLSHLSIESRFHIVDI